MTGWFIAVNCMKNWYSSKKKRNLWPHAVFVPRARLHLWTVVSGLYNTVYVCMCWEHEERACEETSVLYVCELVWSVEGCWRMRNCEWAACNENCRWRDVKGSHHLPGGRLKSNEVNTGHRLWRSTLLQPHKKKKHTQKNKKIYPDSPWVETHTRPLKKIKIVTQYLQSMCLTSVSVWQSHRERQLSEDYRVNYKANFTSLLREVCVHVCVCLTLPQFSAWAEGTGSSRAALSHYFPLKKGTETAVTGLLIWKKKKRVKCCIFFFLQPFSALSCSWVTGNSVTCSLRNVLLHWAWLYWNRDACVPQLYSKHNVCKIQSAACVWQSYL